MKTHVCLIAASVLLLAGCEKAKGMICDPPPPVVECPQAASVPAAENEEKPDADVASGRLAGKLRERRLELERREAEVTRREAALKSTSTKPEVATVKLPHKPSAKEQAAERHEASVQRMVELVAEMKAKNAVNFLSALNDTQGAEILLRLEKSQAAAILAALPPQRAAHITLVLADGGSHAGR